MLFEIFVITLASIFFFGASVVAATLYVARVTRPLVQPHNTPVEVNPSIPVPVEVRPTPVAGNCNRSSNVSILNDSGLGLQVNPQITSKPPVFLEGNPRMWLALLDSHFQATQTVGTI